MKKYKGNFVAKDEAGEEYIIEIYVDEIDVSSHDNANSKIDGRKSLTTKDGDYVNYIRKGEYEIVTTAMRLYSDDPNAP